MRCDTTEVLPLLLSSSGRTVFGFISIATRELYSPVATQLQLQLHL